MPDYELRSDHRNNFAAEHVTVPFNKYRSPPNGSLVAKTEVQHHYLQLLCAFGRLESAMHALLIPTDGAELKESFSLLCNATWQKSAGGHKYTTEKSTTRVLSYDMNSPGLVGHRGGSSHAGSQRHSPVSALPLHRDAGGTASPPMAMSSRTEPRAMAASSQAVASLMEQVHRLKQENARLHTELKRRMAVDNRATVLEKEVALLKMEIQASTCCVVVPLPSMLSPANDVTQPYPTHSSAVDCQLHRFSMVQGISDDKKKVSKRNIRLARILEMNGIDVHDEENRLAEQEKTTVREGVRDLLNPPPEPEPADPFAADERQPPASAEQTIEELLECIQKQVHKSAKMLILQEGAEPEPELEQPAQAPQSCHAEGDVRPYHTSVPSTEEEAGSDAISDMETVADASAPEQPAGIRPQDEDGAAEEANEEATEEEAKEKEEATEKVMEGSAAAVEEQLAEEARESKAPAEDENDSTPVAEAAAAAGAEEGGSTNNDVDEAQETEGAIEDESDSTPATEAAADPTLAMMPTAVADN